MAEHQNLERMNFFVARENANASLVRPCQRRDRQYNAEITTKLLWRASMPKLQRAGMVSTNDLLAITLIIHPYFLSC